MMVTKKLDIIADNISALNKKVETLTNLLEGVVFKLLSGEKLTKEKKEELFKKYAIISPNVYVNTTTLDKSGQFYKDLAPDIFKDYLGK